MDSVFVSQVVIPLVMLGAGYLARHINLFGLHTVTPLPLPVTPVVPVTVPTLPNPILPAASPSLEDAILALAKKIESEEAVKKAAAIAENIANALRGVTQPAPK